MFNVKLKYTILLYTNLKKIFSYNKTNFIYKIKFNFFFDKPLS